MTDIKNPNDTDDHEDRVMRFIDAYEAVENPNVDDLADRFGIDRDEARRIARTLSAFGFADDGHAPDGDAAFLTPPRVPADFELLGEIGRGGMGIVYRARQKSLDRTVAIKVLRPSELLLANTLKRFRREAVHLARLRHKNIVAIHEVGETDGQVWFSMDLIDGDSLATLIREKKITPKKAVEILIETASAVQYIHDQGLVHRDLKPSNILVDKSGTAFVTDFGLAMDVQGSHTLTQSGHVLGTPAYMSPEQALGKSGDVGPAADVYALGACLYECLTGRPPFTGDSLAEILRKVCDEDPVRPTRINRETAAGLEAIAMKALAKRPTDRYASAAEFSADLARSRDGRAVHALSPTPLVRFFGFLRRKKRASGFLTAAALVILALYVTVYLPRENRRNESIRAGARALLATGAADAAAAAYDTLVEARPRPRDFETIVIEAARAHDQAAARAVSIGRLDDAEKHVDRAWAIIGGPENDMSAIFRRWADDKTYPVAEELAWRKSVIQIERGEFDRAVDFWAPMRHRIGFPSIPTDGERPILWTMLDRLKPLMKDPRSPKFKTAARIISDGDVSDDLTMSESATEWFFSLGDEAAEFVNFFVNHLMKSAFDRDDDFTVSRPVADAAHAVLVDETSAVSVRTNAARLIGLLPDFPDLGLGFGTYTETAPTADGIALARDLYPLVRELDREERIRVGVNFVIDRLDQSDLADIYGLAGWLHRHTGVTFSRGSREQRSAEFRLWRKKFAGLPPRAWHMATLGIDEISTPIELLQRARNAGYEKQRATIELVDLLLPKDALRPDINEYGVPDEIISPWLNVLKPELALGKWRLRVATFGYKDAVLQETPIFETSRIVTAGEPIEVTWDWRALASARRESDVDRWIADSDRWMIRKADIRFPGFHTDAEDRVIARTVDGRRPHSSTDRAVIRVQPAEKDPQIVLESHTAERDGAKTSRGTFRYDPFTSDRAPLLVLTPAAFGDRPFEDGMTFVTAEPIDAPADSWSLDQWKKFIEKTVAEIRHFSAYSSFRENLIEMAAFMPSPQLCDLIEQKTGSDTNLTLIRERLLPARLLAGNLKAATEKYRTFPIAREERPAKHEEWLHDCSFWLRFLAANSSEESRRLGTEALGQLSYDGLSNEGRLRVAHILDGLGQPRPAALSGAKLPTGFVSKIKAANPDSTVTLFLQALLHVLVLLAVIGLVATRRRSRLRIAFGLLAVGYGLLQSSFVVYAGERDLSPEWFGLLAVGLGAAVLGIGTRATPATFGAGAFFAAAIFDIYGRLSGHPLWPTVVANALVGVGLLALVASIDYPRRRADGLPIWRCMPLRMMLVFAIPLIAYHVVAYRIMPDLRATTAIYELLDIPDDFRMLVALLFFLGMAILSMIRDFRADKRYERQFIADLKMRQASRPPSRR